MFPLLEQQLVTNNDLICGRIAEGCAGSVFKDLILSFKQAQAKCGSVCLTHVDHLYLLSHLSVTFVVS